MNLLSRPDADVILLAAPVAGALASLLVSRYLQYRNTVGSQFYPWIRAILVSVAISLLVSIALFTIVAVGGMGEYHDYKTAADQAYQFDWWFHAKSVLLINVIGVVASTFTVFPANLLATFSWLIFFGKK